MLDELDRVSWTELAHAYGPAGDVPDLIRRVAGPDEEDALQSLYELRARILHQGNVCSATAPAVPFLAALLDDPGTTDPGGIAHLLGDMADIVDPDKPTLAALRATVTAQVDRLLPLLTAAEPWTRLAAAYALGQCPERAGDILTALHGRWPIETDAHARGALVIAAAALDPTTSLLAEAFAADGPATVRAAAALAAARAPAPWPGDVAVAAVRAGWADGDPWLDRDEDAYGVEVGPYLWNWDPIEDLLDHLARADQPAVVTALLASTDPAVREKAARCGGGLVGRYRSVRGPMVQVLATALDDPAPEVREAAVWGLRRAGDATAVAADALAGLVDRDDDLAAGQALAALVEIGDPRYADRLPARLAAGTAGPDAVTALASAGVPADPGLLDAVRHRLARVPADVPFDPAAQLGRLSDGAWPVSHATERVGLVRLLAGWGPAAAPAVPELTVLLRAGQSVAEVAETLAAVGAAAAPAVPLLRDHAASGDGPARFAAARAVWRLAGDPEPALDTAVHEIETDGWVGRAVGLLVEVGEPARRLLTRLAAAVAAEPASSLTGQSGQVALARLLWRWTGEPDSALPLVTAVLRAGWPEARGEAADLAAELGDPAGVDTLRALLADPAVRRGARIAAARALWRHTGEAEVLVEPTLAVLTDRPGQRDLVQALDLLAAFGPVAAAALPTLRSLADRDDTLVYYGAEDNVGRLDEECRRAVHRVVEVIEGSSPART
ncbi:HEAT repeat domain-containing protein [Plantactinospora sp. ZYX-F-223]|uniref:HEAT repeat domain-containing protein n=1 Tax=Plantactinospora sp. ZYX-F-223 TaxID=3144103 RepID=UPI0031FDAE42